MPRFIAFLRAINVGGHNVTMEALRKNFEALGFTDVETFIASGNVIFTSRSANAKALEKTIEDRLQTALGYEVTTFLRTPDEVAAIAKYKPFAESRIQTAGAFGVGFLDRPLDASGVETVMSFRTDIDDFHVNGRELYWLCTRKQSDSTFSNANLERKLKRRATFRGMNTVSRLTAKHGFSAR